VACTWSAETRDVLDAAACGLMQTTDDGTFVHANRVFCNWVGFEEEALVGQRRLQDLLTIGGRIFHQTHWAPLLRMQGSLSEVKLEVLHQNRTIVPMVLNAIRREHEGGYIHDVAAFVARDRDRYEQELLRSRKGLEALVAETNQLHATAKDRALYAEQMIGIVSHDLRNPLSTIAMASELLASTPPAEQEKYLERITRSVDRANRLIMDLLDFTQARVGSGLSVKIAAIDLHATLASIVEDLRHTFPDRTLRHTARGDGACVADANRLAQLVGNLVANAVAYGTRTTPIEVASIIAPEAFSVSVTNDGGPIPADRIATLFQPMTRGTSEPSKSRSVGLGLFIVQEIARAHGGHAEVRSSAEAGTTFTVTFPRSS